METYRFEVDGYEYDFDAIGALEGTQVLGRVNSILGTGLREARGGGEEAVTAAAIIGGLMSNLDDPAVIEIFKNFARRCRVHVPAKGDRPADMLQLGDPNEQCLHFDTHFARRTNSMMLWFGKCFAWQYSDFLASISDTALSKLAVLIQFLSVFQDGSALGGEDGTPGTSGESSPPVGSETGS